MFSYKIIFVKHLKYLRLDDTCRRQYSDWFFDIIKIFNAKYNLCRNIEGNAIVLYIFSIKYNLKSALLHEFSTKKVSLYKPTHFFCKCKQCQLEIL